MERLLCQVPVEVALAAQGDEKVPGAVAVCAVGEGADAILCVGEVEGDARLV